MLNFFCLRIVLAQNKKVKAKRGILWFFLSSILLSVIQNRKQDGSGKQSNTARQEEKRNKKGKYYFVFSKKKERLRRGEKVEGGKMERVDFFYSAFFSFFVFVRRVLFKNSNFLKVFFNYDSKYREIFSLFIVDFSCSC